jgi:hypothetical protein
MEVHAVFHVLGESAFVKLNMFSTTVFAAKLAVVFPDFASLYD